MIIYFYSFIALLFLPTDSSSIRDRNFRNDLVPLWNSRLDSSKKDANSLKIVSNEPFIIQLQMPNSGESTRTGSKEREKKRKRPMKKRVSKLKPLRKRHRQRRDLQSPKIDLERERKSDRLEILNTGKVAEHQSENATTNAISRADVLKALSVYTKKREAKKERNDVKNFQQDEEKGTEIAKYGSSKTPDGNVQRLSPSPLVKMVYPSAPRMDKHLHKYSYTDLMSDRERLEKKIKYIRNLMNLSIADDGVRVRRRSESDRTANKIAKMFLTLSAVNGLHDKLRSKCDDDDDDDDDSYGLWENGKENQENQSKKITSSNEERYKVKKWIEHMKNKRSSSKTCPCMAKERDEESDVFPLEQKLPKNYYLFQKGGGSEESSEAYEDPSHYHRDKLSKNHHNKRRPHKAREDQESKLKALSGKGRKLELPLDDLELYRSKAKQILQNAEEILDKIKEEEEKRLSMPNILANQLKELTSRIQTDPRNNENDLIRKIQKTLGLGSASKSSDGTDGNSFLENVKSFILDPYEKAKALTDESTKKLSTYLLRNLGELQEPGEIKEDADYKGNIAVYFGQLPQKEEEKPRPESLAKENIHDLQSKSTDTVSSLLTGGDENKNIEDSSRHAEDQFKKRMEEIIKEQEKKLNGYEATKESGESSTEFAERTANRKEKQGENETVEPEETLEEIERATPKQQKGDEINNNRDSTENYKTGKMIKNETTQDSTSKESDYISGEEASVKPGGNEESKPIGEEAEQDVLKETLKDFDGNEEPVELEGAPDNKELNFKDREKEADSGNEENTTVELVHEKSNDQEEVPEVVAASTPEEKEASLRDGSNVEITRGNDEIPQYGTDEKIEAKKEQSEEGKSDEETALEEQEKVEAEFNPEINSADDFNKTPDLSLDTKETVGLSDPSLNDGDEVQENTDQKTQREIESQTTVEHPGLLKDIKPDKFLEKMNSNEENDEAGAEKYEQKTFQLEYMPEVHPLEKYYSSEDNEYEKTPGDDQLSKAVVDNEDQAGFSGATVDGENSHEGFDESKKEDSGNQEHQNYTDESISATTKEFSKEILSSQLSGDDGDEASQRIEKPSGEASDANEDGTMLKEANGEVEETQNSGEDIIPLTVGTNNESNEKDSDGNIDDKTLGMTATSEEEIDEKLENSERSNEAPLKSAMNKSQEPDKYTDEIDRNASDPSRGGNDEDSETQDINEDADDKLRLTKPSFDANDGDLKALKESDGNKVVSEEQKEENSDEGEEIRLEAMDKTRELNEETENPDIDGINDTITKEGNSDDTSGTEREYKDTLSRAPQGKDAENSKDESEEISSEMSGGPNTQNEKNLSRDAITDGTLKATLEEDRENFDEGDKEESSLHPEEPEEKLKMIQEHLKTEAVDKTQEVEAVSDDQHIENGDISGEISLKATNNEQANEDDLNIYEEEGEAPLQETLDDKNKETMRQVDGGETILKTEKIDGETNSLEGDKNSDDTLMKSFNEDDQLHSKDADETPLRATLPDGDLVNKEAEENQNKGKEISDEIPLRLTSNEYDKESLVNVEETPLKATRNKDDEQTLEDVDEISLRGVNIDNGLNDEEIGKSNKAGEKVPDNDNAMKDDLAVGTDGQTFMREENPEEDLDDENPLKATNFEEFSNNLSDGDETPLRATTDDTESFKSLNKDDSEESLREVNISSDFNNQVDEQNEDETPLQSVESIVGRQEASEEGYETLRKDKTSKNFEESEEKGVSREDESPLTAADPIQQTRSQKNSKEEISSENLQELHPRGNPLKKSTLQVPTSIAKIMKDLEGQGKDDVTKIENLNPEKIDYIIDKIDEVEQQNKVTDEVDCRKECACAEDIDTRSRNMGRYEIAKDFLQWMKDLQLNRVLSDD